MRRLSGDDGAIAPIVALLVSTVLLGMGALAVDFGMLRAERRELQNSADAAALAVAMDYANANPSVAAAQPYADANALDGASDATVSSDPANAAVTVVATTRDPEGGVLVEPLLSRVLGNDGITVSAEATAYWGGMSSGSSLPLTMSWCDWTQMVGGDVANPVLPSVSKTVYFHGDEAVAGGCAGPAGQQLPGGFGWLPTTGECASIIEAGEAESNTGVAVPSNCSSEYFESLLGQTTLVPVFTEKTGTGSGGAFTIDGFAAFVMDGYRLSGQPAYNKSIDGPVPCSGNDRCIRGRFMEYIDYAEGAVNPGQIDYGATVVSLSRIS